MNYEYDDKEQIEELNNIVIHDTILTSPECDIWCDCKHQAISDEDEPVGRLVGFECDVATRYYEDKQYARAYALSPSENGVAIFVDKKSNKFTFFVLGEDDGFWFISTLSNLSWIQGKLSFVALVSECLSIFNANYKSE